MKNKRKHIITTKDAIKGSLGVFLMIGLSGCDVDDCSDKDLAIMPQSKIDECKERKRNQTTGTNGGSSTHSGFFMPISSSSSSTEMGG